MTKKNKKFRENDFMEIPEYPGGKKALDEFIEKNLKYPKIALLRGTKGTVLLDFELHDTGKISDIKVVTGIGDGCDNEAVRLVKLLKFGKAKNRGIRLKIRRRIKINFDPSKHQVQINYNYQKIEKKKKPEKRNNSSYGYTIKF